MERTIRFVIGILPLLACWFAGPAQATETRFGRYHALVVGNNAYLNLPDLETAVNDAEAVASLLETKYGFEVRLLRNATKRDILRAINDYRAALATSDNFLIYYAGHGWLDRQTNTGYWQPVDAEAEDDLNWIANGELTRRLNGMTANHVMVIADSCYSGTLVRQASSRLPSGVKREEWLKRMSETRSRTAIVSGGLEPVADAGRGGHPVFANALLNALADNDDILEGHELFRKISRPVVLNSEQTPRYSDIRRAGHEGGEFIFVAQGSRVAVTPPAKSGAVDEKTLDFEFWQSVKDSTNPAAFEAYLAQFPGGIFAAVARLKLEKTGTDSRSGAAHARAARSVPPVPTVHNFPSSFLLLDDTILRDPPRATARHVATLKKGARVSIIGRVNGSDWYRVENNGSVKFAYAPILRETKLGEADKQGAESGRLEIVASEGLCRGVFAGNWSTTYGDLEIESSADVFGRRILG